MEPLHDTNANDFWVGIVYFMVLRVPGNPQYCATLGDFDAFATPITTRMPQKRLERSQKYQKSG